MARNLFIVFFISLLCGVSFSKEKVDKKLIRDGYVLAGVDGQLHAEKSKWLFKFSSDLTDGKVTIKAGSSLQILPSASLEKMTENLAEYPQASYRLLNAIITRHENKNYIYLNYFLPLADVKEPSVKEVNEPNQQEPKVIINEPNDVVVIPQDIIDKLSNRRIVRPENLTSSMELKQDSILANRAGFIKKRTDGKKVFVFDGVGRNVPKVSIDLLPCEILELAEKKQTREPERIRFRISGIVTKYKGRYYLLLQQATRLYSHGNFNR